MNAEVHWWFLIVGIVIGGALVYLVMADLRSAEDDGWSGEPLGDEDDDYDDEDDDEPLSDGADLFDDEREPPDDAGDQIERRSS